MKIRRSSQKSICLFIYIHEPFELQKMSFFDIGKKSDYFDAQVKKEYIQINETLQRIIANNKNFKFSMSVSGMLLDQCLDHNNKIIDSFKDLISTQKVELVAETFYHSLAWLFSKEEFAQQIRLQMKILYDVFRKKPKLFRNTELIYNNELAQFIKQMGFTGMLAQGWDSTNSEKSPNYIYTPVKSGLYTEDKRIARDNSISSKVVPTFKVLLKNYNLSNSMEHTKDPYAFAELIDNTDGETINIFVQYDQFVQGRNRDEIYDYWNKFVSRIDEYKIAFRTPSDTFEFYNEKYELDQHALSSWRDLNTSIEQWNGNEIQNGALRSVYELENVIKKRIKNKSEQEEAKNILKSWRLLQNSEYFRNMNTSNGGHEVAYEAYINYMNILNDLMNKI